MMEIPSERAQDIFCEALEIGDAVARQRYVSDCLRR